MTSERLICYTLDLEHDYAGVASYEAYESFSRLALQERLADIIRRYDLKLTVFATGKVLEKQGPSVEFFRRLGAEIELHGYAHIWNRHQLVLEVEKGLRAYEAYFGRRPLGYRSPGGMTSPALFQALAAAGIQYDSSVIPSLRWGVYNNLRSQTRPYRVTGLPLLELPMSVIPKVRLLVAASYIRLLGLSAYRLLFRLCDMPQPLVYLFHLVDVIPSPVRRQLTPFLRVAYRARESEAMVYFEATVQYFQNAGFRSWYMSDLVQRYAAELSEEVPDLANT